jgi:formylglycine-generating enzyme required for sulfatase activity
MEDRVVYGLLLALGQYQSRDLGDADREPLVKQLAQWYAIDPSSGIHSATGWLLRHWEHGEIAETIDQTPMPYDPAREWFTLRIEPRQEASNSNEHPVFHMTFVVFPPGEYFVITMSYQEYGRELGNIRYPVRFSRPFAILDREITRGETIAYGFLGLNSAPLPPSSAMAGPNWYDAVRFCRWLGQQIGLPEEQQPYPDPKALDPVTYPPDPDPNADGLPRNWPIDLSRAGFRLPTRVDWEIACRAGMRTVFNFGGDATLVGNYAWNSYNSQQTVHVPRMLLPNARGLFDMHGNVSEWCHNWADNIFAEPKDHAGPSSGSYRVISGSAWSGDGRVYGTSNSSRDAPAIRRASTGFRVAFNPADINWTQLRSE